ncbi:uncharacterized protein DS421_17g575400 [Arachis hypogaea]|nr:uncharacterized protein DS421_17g575400 [Arachis hypogaea]
MSFYVNGEQCRSSIIFSSSLVCNEDDGMYVRTFVRLLNLRESISMIHRSKCLVSLKWHIQY